MQQQDIVGIIFIYRLFFFKLFMSIQSNYKKTLDSDYQGFRLVEKH